MNPIMFLQLILTSSIRSGTSVLYATLKLKADVIAGTVFPFTGPIKNQKGEIVVKDGVKPDQATLQSMDYLVEGVVGTLAQQRLATDVYTAILPYEWENRRYFLL